MKTKHFDTDWFWFYSVQNDERTLSQNGINNYFTIKRFGTKQKKNQPANGFACIVTLLTRFSTRGLYVFGFTANFSSSSSASKPSMIRPKNSKSFNFISFFQKNIEIISQIRYKNHDPPMNIRKLNKNTYQIRCILNLNVVEPHM